MTITVFYYFNAFSCIKSDSNTLLVPMATFIKYLIFRKSLRVPVSLISATDHMAH